MASLVIGAIPIGDTLSDGTHSFTASADHTSVDVHTWTLSNLTITPTNDVNFTLTVTGTVQDFEGDVGPSATTTEHVTVAAPPPVITAATAVAGPSPADNDSGESQPDDPSATGTVKFADFDTNDTFQASFSADGHGYQGTFTLGAVSQANGSGSVAWSFMGPDFGATRLDQSYDITITDSFGSQVKETVSVIVGTTGNDTLTAHKASTFCSAEAAATPSLPITAARAETIPLCSFPASVRRRSRIPVWRRQARHQPDHGSGCRTTLVPGSTPTPLRSTATMTPD